MFIMTVARMAHLLKVKNLIDFSLKVKIYKGMLTNLTEKSPNRTVTKLKAPILRPMLRLLKVSPRLVIFTPYFSHELKAFGFKDL